MSYLPKLTLEEIYFKTIILSITHGISVWGNCSQSLLNSLDHIHARACRIINRLPSSQESSSCLLQCTWLPINYLYKRRILLKMHQMFVGAAPSQILDMFSISYRSTRFCNQFIYLFIFIILLLFISRFVHIEYIQVLEQKDIASPTRFNHLPNPINLETV